MAEFSRREPGMERGFTLIEMLVVIAIIGILASLLLPVLGSVQDKGKRTHCAQNLRSIAIAAHSYADDRKVYPWPRTPAATGREPELKDDAEARACLELLYRFGYVDDPKVFLCKGADLDEPALPIVDPAERRESFRLEAENASFTWRKRLTTSIDESSTPIAADRHGSCDERPNHKGGRNIAFKGTNVMWLDDGKLEDAKHPDAARARAELVGFERVRTR